MTLNIKQEPVFEEQGGIADTGGLSMSSCTVNIKNEDCTYSDNTVTGPSIKPDPEVLGLVKPEESPTNQGLEAVGHEGDEPEESLSDEGIGRSPDISECVTQSHSEEETGTSSASAKYPRKGLELQTELDRDIGRSPDASEYVTQSPSEKEAGTSSASAQYPREGLELLTELDREIFYCNICTMAFTEESHLLRHGKKHTFVCQFCGKQFVSDFELLEHEDIHKKDTEYSCNECNKLFENEAELQEHYGNHVFACSYCDRTYTNNIALFNHEQGHQDTNLNCGDCGKIFNRSSNLQVHKRKHCSARSQFVSRQVVGPRDGVQESNIEGTTGHRIGEDNKTETVNSAAMLPEDSDNGWEQDDAGSPVVEATTLKRGSDMYFHCSECPHAFSSSQDFARHVLIHQGTSGSITSDTIQSSKAHLCHEAPTYEGYECKECETTYLSIKALQNHILKHIHACDLCDKTFTNLRKLKSHVRDHNQVFQCQKCQQQFKQQHFLKAHIERVHSPSTKDVTGTSSAETPSSHTKEAKSSMKPSSSKSLPRNQVVKKGRSPQLSYTNIQDSFSHQENIGKAEQVLEKRKDSIPVSNECSTKKPSVFKCSICEKSYARKCDLTMHMNRGKHEHPREQTSSALLMETPSHHQQSSNREHDKSPSQNATYACSLCSKKFTTENNLSRHMKLAKHGYKGSMQDIKLDKSPGSVAQCKICSKEFATKRYFASHIKRKHPELKSNTKTKAEGHKESELQKIFKCPECQKTYGRKSHLQQHIKFKHPQRLSISKQNLGLASSSSGFRCKICSKTFSKQYSLSVHMKLGKHVSNSSIQCSICSTIFKQKRYLSDHMRRQHPELKANNAKVEGLKNSRDGESMHMKQAKHQGTSQQGKGGIKDSATGLQKIFKCPECSKAYGRTVHLRRHIKLKHRSRSKQKHPHDQRKEVMPDKVLSKSPHSSFVCRKCPKEFPRKCGLNRHLSRCNHKRVTGSKVVKRESHTGSNLSQPLVYSCTKCPKSYGCTSSLLRHMKYKHPMHQCQKCLKSFAFNRYLTAHMQRRHPESCTRKKPAQGYPTSSHQCSQCPRAFSRKSDFTMHMRRGKHNAEASVQEFVQCPKCSRKFTRRWNLLKHMKKCKHTSQNRKDIQEKEVEVSQVSSIRCSTCSKSFSRQCDLSKHMKICKQQVHLDQSDAVEQEGSLGSKMFACSKCARSYKREAYLQQHMDSKHSQNESNSATDVEDAVVFSEQERPVSKLSKGQLPDTMASGTAAPSSEKAIVFKEAWKCPECGKHFANRVDLRRHQDTHVFMCNYCNRFFTTGISLEEHACAQKKNALECKQCHMNFENAKQLSIHKRRDECSASPSHLVASKSSKPPKNLKVAHKCELCKKTFSSSSDLKSHQEQHTLTEFEDDVPTSSTITKPAKSVNGIPERMLKCRFCDKVFLSLECVHDHERSHMSSM